MADNFEVGYIWNELYGRHYDTQKYLNKNKKSGSWKFKAIELEVKKEDYLF